MCASSRGCAFYLDASPLQVADGGEDQQEQFARGRAPAQPRRPFARRCRVCGRRAGHRRATRRPAPKNFRTYASAGSSPKPAPAETGSTPEEAARPGIPVWSQRRRRRSAPGQSVLNRTLRRSGRVASAWATPATMTASLGHVAVRRRYTVHTERADKLFKCLKAARMDHSCDEQMRNCTVSNCSSSKTWPCTARGGTALARSVRARRRLARSACGQYWGDERCGGLRAIACGAGRF